MSVVYRKAEKKDCPIILEFVNELAEYEKLAHEVVATPADFAQTMFGDHPKAKALIAEVNGQPAGMALYFYNYSTFQGRPGLYLEDLYVRPQFRGYGIGKQFFKELARIAVTEGCGRFQWSVLDWNQPAIDFYEKLGARATKEWVGMRLEGDEISKLAESQNESVDGITVETDRRDSA